MRGNGGTSRLACFLFVIWQMGEVGGGRRDKCGAGEAWQETSQECVPCPHCAVGEGIREICGNGQGADQQCEPCERGYFNSKPGPSRCLPCTKCDLYNRVTVYKCRSVIDTECGGCMPDYFESFADMKDSDTVLYPCAHCKESIDHRECEEYKHRQGAPASTTPHHVTLDTTETGNSTTAHSHWKWRTSVLSIVAMLLAIVMAVLACLLRRRHNAKRRTVHIAEALEMQELIDNQKENDRTEEDQENVRARNARHKRIFERDIEAPSDDVKPKQTAPASVTCPAAPTPEQQVDMNHNTVEDKALTPKDILHLLSPVKPHGVKRSLSDPGNADVHPGTPGMLCSRASNNIQVLGGENTVQNQHTVGTVAAVIAEKICETMRPDRPTTPVKRSDISVQSGGYLADRLPKIPPAVVQNPTVAAVPSSSSKVAVVSPISIAALKYALNTVTYSTAMEPNRPQSEHLVEYTPDTSLDEEDASSIATQSDASTILLSGRFPQENSDSSCAEPPAIHRNILLDSIEDNEARSLPTQRQGDATRRRRAATLGAETSMYPDVCAPSTDGGPTTNPVPDATLSSAPTKEQGHIHITINCPSFPNLAPFYGAPTYNNNFNASENKRSEFDKEVKMAPCDQKSGGDDAAELPPDAIHQPTEAEKGLEPHPGTSASLPVVQARVPKSLGTGGGSTIVDLESDDETIPKASMDSDAYDVTSENRTLHGGNCPATCRQSVQSLGGKSTFPVQETMYSV